LTHFKSENRVYSATRAEFLNKKLIFSFRRLKTVSL